MRGESGADRLRDMHIITDRISSSSLSSLLCRSWHQEEEEERESGTQDTDGCRDSNRLRGKSIITAAAAASLSPQPDTESCQVHIPTHTHVCVYRFPDTHSREPWLQKEAKGRGKKKRREDEEKERATGEKKQQKERLDDEGDDEIRRS